MTLLFQLLQNWKERNLQDILLSSAVFLMISKEDHIHIAT